MFYLKHPEHGNKHAATEAECKQLVARGWVRWPRTKEEKWQRAVEPKHKTLALTKK